MGTRGTEIIGMDAGKLVEELNKALADEWLAYYQYWLGAKVVAGKDNPPSCCTGGSSAQRHRRAFGHHPVASPK